MPKVHRADGHERLRTSNTGARSAPVLGDEQMMTARQLAQFMGVNRGTVYRLLKTNQIPGVRFGRSWRFSRSEIVKRQHNAWIE